MDKYRQNWGITDYFYGQNMKNNFIFIELDTQGARICCSESDGWADSPRQLCLHGQYWPLMTTDTELLPGGTTPTNDGLRVPSLVLLLLLVYATSTHIAITCST